MSLLNRNYGYSIGREPQFEVTPELEQLKRSFKAVQIAANPGKALQEVMNSNPNYANIVNICKGQDEKTLFYSMCKQLGIDGDRLINYLQS